MRPKRLALVMFLVVGACSTGSTDDAAASEADLAVAVCEHLRDFANVQIRLINLTTDSVTDADRPERRSALLLEGWDDLIEAARAYQDRTAALDLPDAVDAPALLTELQAGAAAAVAALDDTGAELEAIGPFELDAERGVVGTALNGVEKALSVSEPAVARYERRELRSAFDDEPGCEHVVQWTGT